MTNPQSLERNVYCSWFERTAYNPGDIPLFDRDFAVTGPSVDGLAFSDATSFGPSKLSGPLQFDNQSNGGFLCNQNEAINNQRPDLKNSLPNLLATTTQCVPMGFANLDEVPMELATTDDEGQHEEENVVSTSDATSPTIFSESLHLSEDHSLEMDEMELRSRALRSLLLRKRLTPPKDVADTPPVEDETSNVEPLRWPSVDGIITATLSIGSGKRLSEKNSSRRFIITVGDSSDSDDPFEIKRHITSTSSVSDPIDKSPPRVEKPHVPEKTQNPTVNTTLLQRKMHLLRQRLTVKRQQRIVDERKKISRKLSSKLRDLRKKMKHTEALIKCSDASLLRAKQELVAQQKNLLVSDKLYRQTCAILNRSKPLTNTQSISSESSRQPHQKQAAELTVNYSAQQRKELMLSSLKVLQSNRVTTSVTSYFRFECNNSNRKLFLETKEQPVVFTSTRSSERIDSSVPLCPYLLDGDCKDASCTFQHPTFLTNRPTSLSTSVTTKRPTSVLNEGSLRPRYDDQTISTTRNTSAGYCDLCKCDLPPSSTNQHYSPDTNLHRWHLHYLQYQKSFPKHCEKSLAALIEHGRSMLHSAQQPPSETLLEHHIFALCLQRNIADHHSDDFIDCLRLAGFHLEICKSLLRNQSLVPVFRRRLADAIVKLLLTAFTGECSSASQSLLEVGSSPNALANTLVYILYHVCRIDIEMGEFSSASNRLDVLLNSSLPKTSVPRYAVWWLKLNLLLTNALPSESTLFSVINMPLFSNEVIVKHDSSIKICVAELHLPSESAIGENPFDSSDALDICSVCYSSLAFLYAQYLHATNQNQLASRLCWSMSRRFPQNSCENDAWFTTGVFFQAEYLIPCDWPTTLSHFLSFVNDSSTPEEMVSYRIEFGFLFAAVAYRKGLLSSAETALLETVGSMIFIPSEDQSCILHIFRTLLGLQGIVPYQLCSRGSVHLWLSYSLYCMIHSIDLALVLDQLVNFYHHCFEATEWMLNQKLLHMIITLANRLYTVTAAPGSDTAYAQVLHSTLIARPIVVFPVDRCVVPSWFVELLQRINFASLQSPGSRHDLCVQLVEVYGTQVVPSLCRSLLALGDRFLAKSVCAIARLDLPDQEDFWLVYASLLANEVAGASRECSVVELLASAVGAVPSSAALWRHYAMAIKAAGRPPEAVVKRAESLQMHPVVLRALEPSPPSLLPSSRTGH